jgi:hypothetical protein
MTTEEMQALVAMIKESLPLVPQAPATLAPETQAPATPYGQPPVVNPYGQSQYGQSQSTLDPRVVAGMMADILKASMPQSVEAPNFAEIIDNALSVRDAAAKREGILSKVPQELQAIMPADIGKLEEFLASPTYAKMSAPFQEQPAKEAAPAATTPDGQTTAPVTDDTTGAASSDAPLTQSEAYSLFSSIFEEV